MLKAYLLLILVVSVDSSVCSVAMNYVSVGVPYDDEIMTDYVPKLEFRCFEELGHKACSDKSEHKAILMVEMPSL
jgi:hypothetical protein